MNIHESAKASPVDGITENKDMIGFKTKIINIAVIRESKILNSILSIGSFDC